MSNLVIQVLAQKKRKDKILFMEYISIFIRQYKHSCAWLLMLSRHWKQMTCTFESHDDFMLSCNDVMIHYWLHQKFFVYIYCYFLIDYLCRCCGHEANKTSKTPQDVDCSRKICSQQKSALFYCTSAASRQNWHCHCSKKRATVAE